jgi:hypothetical protein
MADQAPDFVIGGRGDSLLTMSDSDYGAGAVARAAQPSPLRAALRQARIEAAERTGVVVDMHDAELARLEILNEALDPIFADVPTALDLFDRGVVPGEPPRLWIDMVAHVVMGRDKRVYRFLQDTRYGRRVLAESAQTEPVVQAVTQYLARRLVERERALAGDPTPLRRELHAFAATRRKRRWKAFGLFVAGMAAGAIALLAFAWLLTSLVY